MPSMNLSDLPSTVQGAQNAVRTRNLRKRNGTLPKSTLPNGTQKSSRNLFQKIFGRWPSRFATKSRTRRRRRNQPTVNSHDNRSQSIGVRPKKRIWQLAEGRTRLLPVKPALVKPTSLKVLPPKPQTATVQPIESFNPRIKFKSPKLPKINVASPPQKPQLRFPAPFSEIGGDEAESRANPFTGVKLTDKQEKVEQKKIEDFFPNEQADPKEQADVDKPALAAHAVPPKLLAKRDGMVGLKGFCLVALRDHRDLVPSKPEFRSSYKSTSYLFSTATAKEKFDMNPVKYAPVFGGADVVLLATHHKTVEGSLECSVWHKGRLYLFSNPESVQAFYKDPDQFAEHVSNPFAEAQEWFGQGGK